MELAPDDLTVALHRLTGWALDSSLSLDSLRVLRPSLEDVYLQLPSPRLPALQVDDPSDPSGD